MSDVALGVMAAAERPSEGGHTEWWVALGIGLVVAVVVVVLLETFLRQVHRIERDAEAIWEAGKQVAANTATTWQLQQTSEGLDAVADEALRHEVFLRTGSQGS